MRNSFTLLLSIILLCLTSRAQTIIYQEGFQSGMPSGYILINNDGLTPASQVSFVNNAWVVAGESGNTSNSVAVSNSWYSPAGVADDWMITTGITPTASSFLRWEAKAVDPSYPDGYKVLLSTTGTSMSDFTVPLANISAENADWTTHHADIRAYAGQTVYIAFVNNSNDKYLLYVDNITVFEPLANDLSAGDIPLEKYILAGNQNVSIQVANIGSSNITSFDVNAQLNTGSVITQSVTGVNISPFTNYTYNLPSALNLSTPGLYTVKIWTSNPNGTSDLDVSNDTSKTKVSSLSSVPNKKVLVEEFTGAWCGYCPDGALRLQQILDNNPNAIGVSVHYGDGMEIPEGLALNNAYADGWPSGTIDRVLFDGQEEVGINRGIWATKTTERGNAIVPAIVSLSNVTFDPGTRQLSVDVNSTFFGQLIGEARLNLMIKEDKVTGTGSQYDQINYYSSQSSSGGLPGHPYYNEPYTIVGYEHMHTLRKMLGGAWGSAGSVPSTVTDGQTITKSYTYTIPSNWKLEDLYLQGLLQEYNADPNQRNILNSAEIKLSTALSVNDPEENTAILNVYPNPFSHSANVEFSLAETTDVLISVYNVTGQEVAVILNETLNAGLHTARFNSSGLNSGVYFVKIKTDKGEAIQRVVITK